MDREDILFELRNRILKDDEGRLDFKKERDFRSFISALKTFPSVSASKLKSIEPYRSLAFLSLFGSRPVSSSTILEILVEAKGKPLLGQDISRKFAEKLNLEQEDFKLITSGGNYSDRVGDVLSALIDLDFVQAVRLDDPTETGYVLRASRDVAVLIKRLKWERRSLIPGQTESAKEIDLIELFQTRFDSKVGNLIKHNEEIPFNVGLLISSLIESKASFYTSLRVLMELEKKLMPRMNAVQLFEETREMLSKYEPEAARIFSEKFQQTMYVDIEGALKELPVSHVYKMLQEEAGGKRLQKGFGEELVDEMMLLCRRSKATVTEERLRSFVRKQIENKCMSPKEAKNCVGGLLKRSHASIKHAGELLTSHVVRTAHDTLQSARAQMIASFIIMLGYLPFKDVRENIDFAASILSDKEQRSRIASMFKIEPMKVPSFRALTKAEARRDDRKDVSHWKDELSYCSSILARANGSL